MYEISLEAVFMREGHKGGKWTGASFIGEEAERAGAVQPGEEMAQRDLIRREDEGARGSQTLLWTRGNGHKLNHVKFHLHTRKHFFTVRAVKHCDRSPSEAVESPSVERILQIHRTAAIFV
ncbi:hypothetical protein QYF61_009257 [Mycteria americana]|uniref:Uncharacterized protein n=1 Tax=Mycteria americana TaxID=33587 RepID=A0AAN7NKW1_MYCAM|nr:hypothetical protein QYF61_009257 [Mycteria americana]